VGDALNDATTSGLTLWILLALGTAQGAGAAELWIGGATTSITPEGPVAVSGAACHARCPNRGRRKGDGRRRKGDGSLLF